MKKLKPASMRLLRGPQFAKMWPFDSNDIERIEREWAATKEESPPRLSGGPSRGHARRRSAFGEGLTTSTTSQAQTAIRGECGGRSGVKSNSECAKHTKAESCQRMNADSSQGPVSRPVPESLTACEQLVHQDEHAPVIG